jgi:phosphatidylglycerophosphate synthase
MDLGLYKLKIPARRLIGAAVPLCRHISPDLISWSILPLGIATAAAYYFADSRPWLLLVGPPLILLRMFLATLDGLVAETYRRFSPTGEIVNRLPPEIADVLLLLALTLSSPARHLPGTLALATAWLTTFSGLIGLSIHRPIQSVGPVGQTDRLAALIALSLAGYTLSALGHPFDALTCFLIWSAAGGCLTIILRLYRALRRPKP